MRMQFLSHMVFKHVTNPARHISAVKKSNIQTFFQLYQVTPLYSKSTQFLHPNTLFLLVMFKIVHSSAVNTTHELKNGPYYQAE